MKKRIINYRLKIDNLLANPDKISKEEWKNTAGTPDTNSLLPA